MKLAPGLSYKSLFPMSTEKQNVPLMLKIFDIRNNSSLKHFENKLGVDTTGTQNFITHMTQLWNILNTKNPYLYIIKKDPFRKPIFNVSDDNFRYLEDSLKWLNQWKDLKFKPREGVLSNETMFAFSHTLLSMTEMAKYLLTRENYPYEYVLLGKFTTDPLEKRFSCYRTYAGSNYHVSIQNIIEGEKKLKLMSILKLVSASKGSIKFEDFEGPLKRIKAAEQVKTSKEYMIFLDRLSECESIELSETQLKPIVFISGYSAKKVCPKISCVTCRAKLSRGKMSSGNVDLNNMNNCYSYINELDRGGLLYPTDFLTAIVSEAFKVFQWLINSKDLETTFISLKNQRNALFSLIDARMESLKLGRDKCSKCKKESKPLLMMCLARIVNIFLNNYAKLETSKALVAKKNKSNNKVGGIKEEMQI